MSTKLSIYLNIALALIVAAVVLGLSYATIDGFTLSAITGCVVESATGGLTVTPCK